MLEQPFPPYDLWDHSRLQREIETPLCLDESIVSEVSARQAIEMRSCRIVNIKVGRVGGVIEARRIHDTCERADIPVWCGGMLESGIGRAHNLHIASLPNFRMPSDLSASKRYYAEDLIDPAIELETDGTVRVPGGPASASTRSRSGSPRPPSSTKRLSPEEPAGSRSLSSIVSPDVGS